MREIPFKSIEAWQRQWDDALFDGEACLRLPDGTRWALVVYSGEEDRRADCCTCQVWADPYADWIEAEFTRSPFGDEKELEEKQPPK